MTKTMITKWLTLSASALLFFCGMPDAKAQSTPSEFAELSLRELFELDIEKSSAQDVQSNHWILSYAFTTAEYDGYLDGDSSLRIDEVLWSGPQEQRTDKNFPIVPTVIRQQVHQLGVGYQLSLDWTFYLNVPIIEQSSDHVSIIPGYDEFNISTQGVGDIVVSANYRILDNETYSVRLTGGVSMPTGTIDEQGDTPRAPGDQQLPYTMQKGSGTWDFPLELTYQSKGQHDFSLSASAMLRTGTNDRNYRLGNHYRIGGKYRLPMNDRWGIFAGGDFQYSQAINGQDDEITLDGPFPYPASITNPDLYGGRKLSVRGGAYWQINAQYQLSVELGRPVYQHLNGPQPRETWRGAFTLSRMFAE